MIIGGIGFPVLFELRRRWRHPQLGGSHPADRVRFRAPPRRWAPSSLPALEWSNPRTLGPLDPGDEAFGGLSGRVHAPHRRLQLRRLRERCTDETLMVTDAADVHRRGLGWHRRRHQGHDVLPPAFVIWTEVRGERDTTIAHRRISTSTMRQALTVALLGVAGSSQPEPWPCCSPPTLATDVVAFEATSAFATVGLSTGITAGLPASAKLTLMGLMFVGRVGTITVASALALRTRHHHYRLPEERPIVG